MQLIEHMRYYMYVAASRGDHLKGNKMQNPKLAFKEYTQDGQQYRLTVEGGVHYIRGNSKPYFSITAAQDRKERGRWEDDCGGCCHELIAEQFPGQFDDLIALHLSDIDGAPMHSLENGWYWMGGTKYQARDDKTVARHFRITESEASDLTMQCATKSDLAAWIETQRPRWKAEADACIARLGLIVYGDAWKEAA